MDQALLRHIRACRNAALPAGRVSLSIAGEAGSAVVGWVPPTLTSVLAGLGAIRTDDGVRLEGGVALPGVARALAQAGHFRWRGEAFDVRADPDGPALAVVDRGALPLLGIAAEGVHVNGLVRRADGVHLWVARRAMDKQMDPGKLDHIAAGGVPAGLTAMDTLVKEAAEEACIPEALARTAVPAERVSYVMLRDEGLRRDRLHCFDLWLPEDFVPSPGDGEVSGFELWPVERVLAAVRETDDFKFNVNLVLIGLFGRLGLLADRFEVVSV